MDYIFLTGLLGSLVLVTGAAWPNQKASKHPTKSVKNWLFAIGGLILLIYAILGYQKGGAIFFVFLEVLVTIASVLMMLDIDDRTDTKIISFSGLGLIIWSLYLFDGYNTVFFILGLCGIGLGYAFKMGTIRRDVALTFGSALIALFSYLEYSWVFFWLNIFFAIFSGYYLLKNLNQKNKRGNTSILPYLTNILSFKNKIIYLKVITIAGIFFSFLSLITKSFDPFRHLETQMWQQFFGGIPTDPNILKTFQFPFILFCILSLSILILQWYITKYALEKREKWAYEAILLGMITWIAGATIMNLLEKNYFYIYSSVIPISIIFLPIMLLMWQDIYGKK